MKKINFAIIFLLLLLVAQRMKLALTKVIEINSERTTTELKVNEEIDLRFNSNPTTGYNWYIDKEGSNIDHLLGSKNLEEAKPGSNWMTGTFKRKAHPEGMVGVGGITSFIFQALQPGTVTLKFYHFRLWDEKTLSDPFEVTINIIS